MKYYLSSLMVLLIIGCSSTPSIKEMTIRMGSTNSIEVTDLRSIVRNGLLTAQAQRPRIAVPCVIYEF